MESILWAPHRFFPCQSMCECATINSHCIYEYVVCCLPMVWWWLFSSFLHCPMAALKPQFQRDEMPTTLSISIITRAHTTWFNSFFGCLFTMYHSFYVDFSWIFTLKSVFCCGVQQFQLDRKKVPSAKHFPGVIIVMFIGIFCIVAYFLSHSSLSYAEYLLEFSYCYGIHSFFPSSWICLMKSLHLHENDITLLY